MMRLPLITWHLIEGVRARRWLVALLYFGLTVVELSLVLDAAHVPGLHSMPYFVLATVAMGALAAGYSGLILIPWVAAIETKRRHLDERLGQRRRESYAKAYRIFTVVFCCQGMAWILRDLIVSDATVFRYAGMIEPLIMFDVILLASLPMAIFAWTEPDPVREEPEPQR